MSILQGHENIIKHLVDVNGSQMVFDVESREYALIKLVFPDDECLCSHSGFHKLNKLIPVDAQGECINEIEIDD